MKIISLFTGAGGLDLGFEQAGFNVIWANEYDRQIVPTYIANRTEPTISCRDLLKVSSQDLPRVCRGIIGGPPCQSWSVAGAGRGLDDSRGQLMLEYQRILGDLAPDFFVAENVKGMTSPRHAAAFDQFVNGFHNLGYNVVCTTVDAADYGVAQNRERVIFVGYHFRTNQSFKMPPPNGNRATLRDVIGDLSAATPALPGNEANPNLAIVNHEYFFGDYSSHYMSRNRRRGWDEPSFTIQASGRHAPQHPDAAPMEDTGEKDKFRFTGKDRRLSVHECALIQGFPKNYRFQYRDVNDGYKMVGNAVPPPLAKVIAETIKKDLFSCSAPSLDTAADSGSTPRASNSTASC